MADVVGEILSPFIEAADVENRSEVISTEELLYEVEKVNGDLIFAYSTGDMGYFEFINPLDSVDNCSDCIDNDGDGQK